MNFISEIFTYLFAAVVTFFDFVLELFSDFFTFLKLIGKVPEFLVGCFTWLPEPYSSLLFMVLFVVIVYKILGRD